MLSQRSDERAIGLRFMLDRPRKQTLRGDLPHFADEHAAPDWTQQCSEEWNVGSRQVSTAKDWWWPRGPSSTKGNTNWRIRCA